MDLNLEKICRVLDLGFFGNVIVNLGIAYSGYVALSMSCGCPVRSGLCVSVI